MSKIKVIKQHDIKDCGVCSLQCIISYYKGFVPLEKLRLDTHTNEEGTSALNLINASQKYGFDSVGVKVDTLFNDSIKLPAIAHVTNKLGIDHFVVIYKITSQSVYLMDPAKGKVTMTNSEFLKIWNNVLLLFYPKQKIIFMPKENNLSEIFFKLLKEQKKIFLSIFLASIFLTVFTILNSYYFKVAIQVISNHQDLNYLFLIMSVFALLMIFKLLFGHIRKSLENHLNKNIDCLLLSDFLNHIFNLPLEVIKSRTSGEVMTRVNELINIKGLFTEIVITCLLDLLLIICSIPILYSINSNLFFILFFIVIIYLFVGGITSKIIYKMVYRNIDYETEFNSTLIENITLINSIKNLNQTKSSLRKIETKLSTFLYDNFKLMKFLNGETTFKLGISEVGLFLINTLGFYLIYQNKLDIAELITFNTLVVYYLDPIKNIIDALPKYNFIKASFTKINEFLAINKENLGKAETLNHFPIEVQKLNYSYNNYTKVVNNVTFQIKEKEHVLLKGKSGSGKSTICKIILKYLNDYDGNILIGKSNIKDLSVATIRSNITFVSQNESLFTGSIRENILFGRNVSLDLFNEVCRICQIEEIVKKKPLRYETIINNESHFISGGERQRIILARALLQNSSIYLIDEALSEVDLETEKTIVKNIQKYLKNKTIIYITHKNQDELFSKIINLEA